MTSSARRSPDVQIDRIMRQGSWLDYGMFLQSIMVARAVVGWTPAAGAFMQFHASSASTSARPTTSSRVRQCRWAGRPNAIENTLVTEREPVSTSRAFSSSRLVPVDFILFALTLTGVAVFHHHTLRVAVIGLVAITGTSSRSAAFAAWPVWTGWSRCWARMGHARNLFRAAARLCAAVKT